MEEEAWLFSSDDEVAEDDTELQINEQYAKHYAEFRAKEIAQNLKDREAALKKLEHEDDSEEDEDDETDMNNIVSFLTGELSSNKNISSNTNGLTTSCEDNNKKKKKKKFALEVYRKELFDKMSSGEVPEYHSDDQEMAPPKCNPKKINLFDDEEELKFDKLIVSQEEKNKRVQLEKELKKKSEDRTEDLLNKMKAAKENSELEGEDKSKEDAILNMYISELQKQVQKKSKSKANGVVKSKKNTNEEAEDSSEEETVLKIVSDTAKLFERDESKASHPISYPNKLDTKTVRDKTSKRKEAREKKKERKEAEMMRLRQEVNELKAVKKKEIQAKLEKLKEITGQSQLAFGEEDFEKDFDPEEHDRLMEMQNQYAEVDVKKPKFDYDEDLDFEDYDEFQADDSEDNEDQQADFVTATDVAEEGNEEEECNGEDTTLFSGAPLSRRRRRGRSKKFTEALLKKKPKFDPAKHMDFEKYYEEYYGLDFEDVIGDVKCRFKYKTVNSNDLGLSTEEILMADDKELNKFYSLKKLLRNDRTSEMERKEKKRCANKVRDEEYMTKHFPSLYVQEEEEANVNAANSTIIDEFEEQRKEEEKKKAKNLKKKLRREKKLEGESSINETVAEKEETNGVHSVESEKKSKNCDDSTVKDKKTKKRKRKNDSSTKERSNKSKRRKIDGSKKFDPDDPFSAVLQISNDRLSAYGLPAPVQLKKKISHLKKQEKKGAIKDAMETFRFPTKSTEKRKKQLKGGKKKKPKSLDSNEL